jgi:hypothetical protein
MFLALCWWGSYLVLLNRGNAIKILGFDGEWRLLRITSNWFPSVEYFIILALACRFIWLRKTVPQDYFTLLLT